jgi:hypothetical protein
MEQVRVRTDGRSNDFNGAHFLKMCSKNKQNSLKIKKKSKTSTTFVNTIWKICEENKRSFCRIFRAKSVNRVWVKIAWPH